MQPDQVIAQLQLSLCQNGFRDSDLMPTDFLPKNFHHLGLRHKRATGIALSSLLIAAYSQPGELRTSKQAPEKPAAPLWLWERLCIIV